MVERKVDEFEEQLRADLDAKRDDLKVRPSVAIDYDNVRGVFT